MAAYTKKLEELSVRNPTLRDCFDPSSREFLKTTMQQKVITLQKVIANDLSLQAITVDYCILYETLSMPYVAKDLHLGLKTLINHLLEKHNSFQLQLSESYSNKDLVVMLTALLLNNTKQYLLPAKQIL